jgi:hypothetical protein
VREAAATPLPACLFRWSRMTQPASAQQMPLSLPPARKAPRAAIAGAALGAMALLGTLVLWFHYGTAVFFEMVASGIAACL